jgi:hypothetical protein
MSVFCSLCGAANSGGSVWQSVAIVLRDTRLLKELELTAGRSGFEHMGCLKNSENDNRDIYSTWKYDEMVKVLRTGLRMSSPLFPLFFRFIEIICMYDRIKRRPIFF